MDHGHHKDTVIEINCTTGTLVNYSLAADLSHYAMWIGRCYANGTTQRGWTHEQFKAHLAFLDTVGITRIGIWCQNSCSISNISNPLDCGDNFVGFACSCLNNTCPYFYEELAAWKARAPQH